MGGERILIVEDESDLASALEDRLTREGYSVTLCHGGVEGEKQALAGQHDALILEPRLADRDGLTMRRHLRHAGLTLPILLLPARSARLEKGVLVTRLAALLRRVLPSVAGTDAVRAFGPYRIDETRHDAYFNGRPLHLHPQEYRLLLYLADHPNRVLDRDEILDQVWGYESDTTTRTVDVHVAKLRRRLGESELPRHIRTVRGRGYEFRPEL
jgi:DNA-binding response OmpR family regulator